MNGLHLGRFGAVMTIWALAWAGTVRAQDATAAAATGATPAATPATKTDGSEVQKKSGKLDTVVVTESDLTTTDVAAHDLDVTSGATSLILGSDYLKGRASNASDLLRFQAGVTAQSNNGGEQTRLSIRGSGIQRAQNTVPQGIQFLLSGQSIKTSSGYSITSYLEPLAVNYAEVYRGQAAFADYGPLAIGGAINFVTKTGYDASPFQVRSEVGSDGYFKEQASSGLVSGIFDYYASVTHDNYDGFRDNSRGSATRAIFNLGWQVTPDVTTRFAIEYTQQMQQNPGALTLFQVQHTPQMSSTPTYVPTRLDPENVNVTSNTNIRIDDDSSLSFGALFLKSQNNNPGSPTANTEFNQYALNGSAHYTRSDLVGNHQTNTKLTLISNNVLDANERYLSGGVSQVTAAMADWEGHDTAVVLSTDFEIVPGLWINPGVAGLWQHRAAQLDNLPGLPQIHRDYEDFAPDLGLRYEFNPHAQVYFNAGRTVEAPYGSSYVRTATGGAQAPNGLLNLEKQIADTVEIGTRGDAGIFQWDLALYNSWLQHELLTTTITPPGGGPVTATANANDTIHQGIELGLNSILWHESDPTKKADDSLWATAPESAPHRLVLQQSFTLNHFTFDNDPTFGNNDIAGIPTYFYQAELRYEHPSGFHIGPTVESSLSTYEADHANTISAPSYAVFGAKVGYAPPKQKWEVFFEADNLANEKYVEIVAPTLNAHGVDSAVYTPGVGRSVSGGFSYSF